MLKHASGYLNEQGFSLLELMVGIAVGLVVVAGASLMMTHQLADHRRLALETQVQQDLRATADLMLRDLRRAGTWATPQNGVWAPASTDPLTNVYTATTPSVSQNGAGTVLYSYSRNTDRSSALSPEDNLVTTANEQFGFRQTAGVLQFRIGDAWQPLTDPNTLTITAFSVNLTVQSIDLSEFCESPCPVGSTDCPPRQQVRRFDIALTGRAVHDAKVERTVNVSSRIRNDRIAGGCK